MEYFECEQGHCVVCFAQYLNAITVCAKLFQNPFHSYNSYKKYCHFTLKAQHDLDQWSLNDTNYIWFNVLYTPPPIIHHIESKT